MENELPSATALQQVVRILEGVSDACVVLDRDWRYVYVNARAGRLFNRLPEQLVGKHIWTEFPEGIDQEFYRAYYRAAETQQVVQLEAYYPPWDRWFENRIHPSPDGLVIFFHDVTEQRASERERRQLARVLEATKDVVAVCDVEGRVRFVNAAARELLGLETGASLRLDDLHAPRVASQLHDEAIPGATRQGAWMGETVLRRNDGGEVPVLASLVYEGPSGGDSGFLALVARDITRRKRAEDEARHEVRVRAMAERMAHLGMWEWRIATNHVQWSNELYRIYGLDEGTFGASLEGYLARVHPDDRARVRGTIDRAIASKSNVTFDERIIRPDGAIRHLHSWGGVRLSDEGEVLGLVGACLDTTELFQATTELRRNQEWLRMALEASELGLWEWDMTRGKIAWSPGVERLFGIEPGSFKGSYESYLALIHPDDRARVDTAVRTAVERDVDYEVLHRVLAPDGSIRWIEGRGRVFAGERGKRVRMAGSVANVTQRHALEEGVRQSQKMEAIGRLAAGVAHDFNNLLAVILTTTELLSDRPGLDATVREGFDEITDAARRASGLTKQLLTISRKQLPGATAIDLNAIVESSATLLRRLLPEEVRLLVELEPGLWPVRSDPGQMEQVLLNLAVNARDAMPEGGEIRIATRNQNARDNGGPRVALSVIDTGTGMTAETRARVFEPFFTTKPPGKGTGLGLSMVYGIVRQMGGTIDIDTTLGRGTTFQLTIPAQPMAALAAAPVASTALTRSAGEAVLLVDDHDAIRRTLGILLKEMGYRVLEASDAASALRVIDSPDSGTIDVLLTDVGMPQMNGVDLAKRVRSTHPDIGVVFMSGYAERPVSELGTTGIASISKPFSSTQISEVLRTVLAGRRAAHG